MVLMGCLFSTRVAGWLVKTHTSERPNERQMPRSELYRSYYLVADYYLCGDRQDVTSFEARHGFGVVAYIHMSPCPRNYSRTIRAF